jgi:hypothetical protein
MLVGRAARWRAEGRSPQDRIEPRPASLNSSQDADILEVVQKFELVYSQLNARPSKNQHTLQASSIERAAQASLARDTAESTAPSYQLEAHEPRAVADGPAERYELPEEAPVPAITESVPRLEQAEASARPPARVWPKVFGGAALALLIGVGVGYVMVPSGGSQSVRTKIESSPDGGTRLRFDYELHPLSR